MVHIALLHSTSSGIILLFSCIRGRFRPVDAAFCIVKRAPSPVGDMLKTDLFERLSKSDFRMRFKLSDADRVNFREKGAAVGSHTLPRR